MPLDFDLYDGFNVDTESNDSIGSAQSGLSYFENGQTFQLSSGI